MQLQRPALSQEQRLALAQQQIQSVELMALPIVELREKIEEMLEQNPALEVLEDPAVLSLDAAEEGRKEEDAWFETSSDPGFVRRGSGPAESDEHRDFIEGVLSREETLQEHLLRQLQLQPIDDDLRRICEGLIRNLDDDGFHKQPPESIFEQEAPPAWPRRLPEALALVQALEPAGSCTSGYLESLKVQISQLPAAPSCMTASADHLDLLERGKFAELAKKLGVEVEEVERCYELLRELSPFPGRQYAAAEVRYVVPDVQVIRKEGEFVIILNDEEIPVLGLSPFFMKLNDEKTAGMEARDFVRENLKEARWFISSINRRNHTLLRVSRAIVEFQRPFFSSGPKYLSPLTLKDIAEELGLNESTISRAANGKYMQTDWGIFELRYFFTNSISGTGSSGSQYSKEGVKEIIKEILSQGQRGSSDQEIAGLLAKRGISLARRTVTKYRKELGLESSYRR
ncbi:MAG: RNA polymerase factor sigma-54 [Treponema sp.]|nr:RNA polymerase factor sigma-54 [Treponema sp.]